MRRPRPLPRETDVMGNFLESVFEQLRKAADRVVLREVRGEQFVSVTGRELLARVGQARANLRALGLQAGDRCALLGPNSIEWVAIDLALMAEGAVVVPLYARLSARELVVMMRDCGPRFFFVSDAALGQGVAQVWPEAPRPISFAAALGNSTGVSVAADTPPNPRKNDDLVTIIYTSGTSGEPKGVGLNTANLSFMIGCTTGWIDRLGWTSAEPIRVFQYLPVTFAASWIVMLTCMTKNTVLTFSTDLSKLAEEIRLSAPDYFFTVPTLLERVRRGVDDAMAKSGGLIRVIYRKACAGWKRQQEGKSGGHWLALGQTLIFGKIRARFGGNLRGLVCGSAPLAPETQDFFAMLGIPIWQVYGLTETCGICTMDDPQIASEPGRVGQAIPGIDLMVGDNEEIVVRGPNVFSGYWNRPEETARALQGGVFHTGDQGEVNSKGNWRISGRIKNLIILNSGHNIAPEPIEDKIAQLVPGAPQVLVVGNGRGYLCALVTGGVQANEVQTAIDRVNSELPHYRQVRNFLILKDAFTPEDGLLTAMGKLKREAISARFAPQIDGLYKQHAAAVSGSSA
jgi:long-chain acyl-CoA synthetase